MKQSMSLKRIRFVKSMGRRCRCCAEKIIEGEWCIYHGAHGPLHRTCIPILIGRCNKKLNEVKRTLRALNKAYSAKIVGTLRGRPVILDSREARTAPDVEGDAIRDGGEAGRLEQYDEEHKFDSQVQS
jgi:hypothetical protein